MPRDGQTVSSAQYQLIEGHVWDNAAITKVEYRVNGRTICLLSNPLPSFGFDSPFYQCWWKVPRRGSSHEIEIRVTDAAGHVETGIPRFELSD